MATDQEVGGSSPSGRTSLELVVYLLTTQKGGGDHEKWMEQAFCEAEKAFAKQEVPVGAVVLYENRIIGRGHNLVETLQDPTAHAEMLALTAAANTQASWRLNDAILYVTLEPCPMCVGALILSRIKKIVFAATDSRWGACGSVLDIPQTKGIDTTIEVVGGVMAERSMMLLQSFFEKLRKK